MIFVMANRKGIIFLKQFPDFFVTSSLQQKTYLKRRVKVPHNGGYCPLLSVTDPD